MGFEADKTKEKDLQSSTKLDHISSRGSREAPKTQRCRGGIKIIDLWFKIERQSPKRPIKLSPIKIKPSARGNSNKYISLELKIEEKRRVLYRKIHRYKKKEFFIEISKSKKKYYIVAVRMNKSQDQQVIDVSF